MKRRLATLVLGALLAGCGGGLFIGFDGDNPPSVGLAANVTSATPGQVVRLTAAATDDDFVDAVDFYRIDPDGRTFFLGGFGRPPWTLDTVIPASARGNTLFFFARATDSAGQQSDSGLVAVTVQ